MVQAALASSANWGTDFEGARREAARDGKPILVAFSTSWCGACKQMDKSTLSDTGIMQRLDNYVTVKVDGDVRQDLMSSYNIQALPTYIWMTPNGQILDKREGYMRVREMASALDKSFQAVNAGRSAQSATRAVASAPAAQSNGGAQVAQTVATGRGQLLSAPVTEQNSSRRPAVASNNESASDTGARAVTVANNNDPRLQGSVYAMTDTPTSNRSRFGGGSSDSLKELARATADSDSSKKADEEKALKEKAEAERKLAEAKKAEETKKAEEARKLADAKKADEEKARKEQAAADAAEAKARAEADRKALESKPAIQVASARLDSPMIESRGAERVSDSLPRPLLNRSAGASTQVVEPAEKVSSGASGKDSLATIRRIQGDSAAKEEPRSVEVSKETQPIVAEKPAEEPKVVASASPVKPAAVVKSAPDNEPKTETGATRSDIERWMTEADKRLVDGQRKEARAMYTKVVDNDKDNKFGRSDMAFIKMTSLIVDKDSDLLRREAYNKIRGFEARFPDSEHKDYYTLIRAILAVDLGETNEAHRLLGPYADRFPDSKYRASAYKIWKDLPALKKETASKSDSGKSSSSSSKSSSSSSKSSGKSSSKKN